MNKQPIEIWNVENRKAGYTLCSCLSKEEAKDAIEYLTEMGGWPTNALTITAEYAYPNGWFRELIEAEREKKGGTK